MAIKSKTTTKKEVENYLELFYMTPSTVNAKDIVDLLQSDSKLKLQLWEEMNVLELELPGESFVDFEPVEPIFKDPSDSAFVKNRNISTIFAININESALQSAIPYFEQIIEHFGGFVCSDSADFQPVYAGSSNR